MDDSKNDGRGSEAPDDPTTGGQNAAPDVNDRATEEAAAVARKRAAMSTRQKRAQHRARKGEFRRKQLVAEKQRAESRPDDPYEDSPLSESDDPPPVNLKEPATVDYIALGRNDRSGSSVGGPGSDDGPGGSGATTDMAAESAFEVGDEVASGNVKGVVVDVYAETIEWPGAGDEDSPERIEASEDEPVYIVALSSGVSTKPFTGDELSPEPIKESADPAELAQSDLAPCYRHAHDATNIAVTDLLNVPGVDDPETGFASLPNGWDRKTVLKAWASIGASFDSCTTDMAGEISKPNNFCAALADEVFQTEEWRGGFGIGDS